MLVLHASRCLSHTRHTSKRVMSSARCRPVRLLDEIRPMGYTGSVDTVRRFRAQLAGQHALQARATVRFETPAGMQAQCDWADCGKHPDAEGNLVSINAFIMVLGYSRMLYIQFTTSMKLPVLIECHKRAFEFFGGWTQMILYDNMRQVRSGSAINSQFQDFADHYGFVPKTHRPYRPRTKGKVERSVDYVKDNFLNGRSFSGLEDLNAQAMAWLTATANVRLHATTGARPVDLFEAERQKLTSIGAITPYTVTSQHSRTVTCDSMVNFQRSRYSVPPEFIGSTVFVTSSAGQINIRANEMIVAEHAQAARRGLDLIQPEHLIELSRLSLAKPVAPSPSWKLGLAAQVAQRPLSTYQEAAR